MDFEETYDALRDEFCHTTALLTTIALALNLGKIPTEEDFDTPGKYTESLNDVTRDILWEYPKEIVDLVINIRECLYTWNIQKQMAGLGGAKLCSTREVYEKSLLRKEN